MIRFLKFVALVACLGKYANCDLVNQFNQNAQPPFVNNLGEPVAQTFEGIPQIGWYFYNGPGYVLNRVESRFDARNIGLPLEFATLPITISVYTDRPAVGGQLLTSGTFNADLARGGDQGANVTPVYLPANGRYFVGFSGLDPVNGVGFTDNAIGVNFGYWELDGAGQPAFEPRISTDFGAYYIQSGFSQEVTSRFDETNNTRQARTAPILFFYGVTSVPEPTSMILSATAFIAFGIQRYRSRKLSSSLR